MMNLIELDNNYTFGIESQGKKARLVVYKGGVENVCRQETLKNLTKFIQSDENHLFKGRLQLHKSPGGINVMVKGDLIGTLGDEVFADYLFG
jgi:hypothetical protein